MEKTLSWHWLEEICIFARERCGHHMIARYYYASLLYVDLCRWQNITITCRELLWEATKETLQYWASLFYEKVFHRYSIEQDVWIVPALFCAIFYMKMLHTFLKTRNRSWIARGTWAKTMGTYIRYALQVEQLISNLSWLVSSELHKRRWMWRDAS